MVEGRSTLSKVQNQGQGQYAPISHAQTIQQFLKKSLLNPEQRQVIQLMMTHNHQFMLIQGIAGSGKTTTMSVAQSFLTEQDRGCHLLGLAPTHRAVRVLTERGITAQTLQSYLSHHRQSQYHDGHHANSKTILLLDEASMVSNRQMYDFLKSCHDTKTQAVIMGDIQQLPAIEAGKPFMLLQTLDVPIAELKRTERYAEGSPLKSAVSAIHQGNVGQAFEALQQDFYEKKPKLQSLTILAKQYLALPQDQRSKLQIITPSHHDRVLFNNLVRIGLKQQGELGEDSVTVNILVSRNLTRAERTKVHNYRLGDILKFHNSHGLPIDTRSYLKVAELVPKSNAIVLTDQKEQRYYWQLPVLKSQQSLGVEVYRLEQREFSVGDQIRWLCSTNSSKNESRAQSAVVTHIKNDHTLQVKQADRALNTLDLSNPEHLHFDHGYAGTAHALQGITVEQAQLVLRSDQKYLANQKIFLVAISRSTRNIGIHTDDRTRLLERLTHNRGDKTSSIEVIDALKGDKPNSPIVKQDEARRQGNMTQPMNPSLIQYDYNALFQDRLRQTLSSLLKKIMAEGPRKKTQHHYYYGHNKGSLAVSISGEKQGLWYDFQTGQGGNLLQLVQARLGLNFKQALDYVAQYLSLPQKDLKLSKVELAIPIPSITRVQKGSFNKSEQNHVRYAQILTTQSKPITGTLAEQYLRVHRGIQGALPDSLRFHPHVYSKVNNAVAPALLAVAKNQQGQVQAVQAIFLNPTTGAKANLPIQKQTFGVLKGANVSLKTQAYQASPFVFYAEGPETGLSILSAFPRAQIKVLLGAANFKHIPHQQTASHIVLCLDNDKNNNVVSKIYHEVANSLTQAGKQVWLAKPSIPGYDFNDVLIKHGRLAVYQHIVHAQPYAQTQPTKLPSQLGVLINYIRDEGMINNCMQSSKANNIGHKYQTKAATDHWLINSRLKLSPILQKPTSTLNSHIAKKLDLGKHRSEEPDFDRER